MTKLHSILGSVVIVQACIKSALDQALNIDYLPQMTVKPLVFLLEVLYPELTELVDGWSVMVEHENDKHFINSVNSARQVMANETLIDVDGMFGFTYFQILAKPDKQIWLNMMPCQIFRYYFSDIALGRRVFSQVYTKLYL